MAHDGVLFTVRCRRSAGCGALLYKRKFIQTVEYTGVVCGIYYRHGFDDIVAEGITDEEDINKAIDEAAGKLNINLSEEDRQKINDLMQKIGGLDLDVNQLKSQAKQLYDKLGDLNIDVSKEEVQGFLAKIIAWIKQLFA